LQDEATAKRRESNHAAVAALNQERALAELAEMQAQQEAERKMLQIKKKQAVVNAERTAYRKQELVLGKQMLVSVEKWSFGPGRQTSAVLSSDCLVLRCLLQLHQR